VVVFRRSVSGPGPLSTGLKSDFLGKAGQLYRSYHEGMEDQLGLPKLRSGLRPLRSPAEAPAFSGRRPIAWTAVRLLLLPA
jgi:hypothetical protein